MATNQYVKGVISDSVLNFLVYDRKSDEYLPRGEIERLLTDGELTVDEIVNEFRMNLESRLLP